MQEDLALGREVEAGDQPQQRRLAATRGPSSVKNSFSRMVTDTLSSAANWAAPDPNSLLTPRTSIAVESRFSATRTPHLHALAEPFSGFLGSLPPVDTETKRLGNREYFMPQTSPAAADGGNRADRVDVLRLGRLHVAGEDDEVGQEAGLQPAFAIFGKFGIGALYRVGVYRLMQGEALVGVVSAQRLRVTAAWMPAIGSMGETGQSEAKTTCAPALFIVRQA